MPTTWFITGASSGFGRLLTEKLLARGDRVAAGLRSSAALAPLKRAYGDRLWIAEFDVRDPAAVHAAVAAGFGALGRIDVIANSAGYGLLGAAEELTVEQIRDQIDANLLGSIHIIRACLPPLRAQGGGRFLQVSSEGGQITYPGFSVYHATKWGIEGFVEAVAKEVAPFGIAFTLVEPGPAGTNFGAALVRSSPLDSYRGTPADATRRAIDERTFELPGDPVKIADAMIACADRPSPPLRLTLGRGSYAGILRALSERRDALEAQREIAFSTDRGA